MPAILKKPVVAVEEKKPTGRKAKKEQAKKEKAANRSAVYDLIFSVTHVESPKKDQQPPITVDEAKEIMGYEEETEAKPFGNKYLTKINGVKVRCSNNIKNRPLYVPNLESYKQEHLRRRWRFNGEPLIIGVTGLVLNGQHSLLSLIMAAKEWHDNPGKWAEWDNEPTMEKLIVYGVDEGDETVNTMDTCKPRSLSDVIYRAEYFKDIPAPDQRKAAKYAEAAIKMLWETTGTHANAFAMKRTHAESIAFLDRHSRLLGAVRHVYEEDGSEQRLSKFLPIGYAAAALYLMATGASKPEAYYQADDPNESCLSFSQWDTACKFFVELAGSAANLKPIKDYLAKLMHEGTGEVGFRVRWAVLAKAWNLYAKKAPVTLKSITLKFEVKDDESHLVEHPLLGGIDVGRDDVVLQFPTNANPKHATNGDPNKADIKKATEKLRTKRDAPEQVANKKGAQWAKGDTAWVHAKGENSYFATLKDDPYVVVGGIEKVFVEAEDGEWEVAVMDLSTKQFELV